MKKWLAVVFLGLILGVLAAWGQIDLTRTAGDGDIEVLGG